MDELAQHWDALKRLRGRSVLYARGDESIEITAVPGNIRGGTTADGQTRIETIGQDWCLDSNQPLGFTPAEPQPMDTITDIATGATYIVSARGQDKCWRFSGASRAFRRVFTLEDA